MKRRIFIILFFLSPLYVFSQQINKELVVVEIATGTWCQYCPGAAMGADELVENFGSGVAVIEHHGGDIYETSNSSARNAYYGVSGFPTAVFNGGNAVVGGSSTQSMYSTYLPKYNSAIGVLTSFDLTLDVIPVNDYTYSVTVTIDKVAAYAGSNLVAHLALTESHIEESWQGMDELNFVNREMYPNAGGTVLDFSSNDQQTIYYTVNLDQEWIIEHCEIVAFVQDNSSKEVLQGSKFSLNFPIGTNNVMLSSIDYPSGENTICEDAISPVITIKNRGSVNLNSVEIEYEINEGGVQTYTWTGDLAFGESEQIVLDEIVYSQTETNLFEVNLTLPNNSADDDPLNNYKDISFDKSVETTTRTYLEIDPGGSFGLNWEVADSEGTVVYSGNASGSTVVNETFMLEIDKCHTFTIESTFGNGIPGGGYFQLSDSEGNIIYEGSGDSFTDIYVLPFNVTTVSNINDVSSNVYSIYPNPANDFFVIDAGSQNIKKIQITDFSGKEAISLNSGNMNDKIYVETKKLMSGLYFVNIVTEENIFSEKIIVIH